MVDLLSNYLGLGIILFALLMLLAFSVLSRRGFKPALRSVPGFETLDDQVGRAVESGGRLHVALGPNSIYEEGTLVAIAGLAMLDVTGEESALSDLGPIASTADPTTLTAAADTIRRSYERRDEPENFDSQAARLTALTPVGYAGSVTSIVHDDRVQANAVIGSFGPEVAIIAESGIRKRIPQTIGSDRLQAQAAAYAMATYPLIGEELFVVRAYLDDRPGATAGLATQDILRWIVIAIILVGAAMQTLGISIQ